MPDPSELTALGRVLRSSTPLVDRAPVISGLIGAAANARPVTNIGRLDTERKFIDSFLGIPIVNFSVPLGIEDPFVSFFVDALLDPLNFIGTGYLKAGRVAAAGRTLNIPHRAKQFETLVNTAHEAARLSKSERTAVLEAFQRADFETLQPFLGRVNDGSDSARRFFSGDDGRAILSAIESGSAGAIQPSTINSAIKGVEAGPLAVGFAEQARAGQRSLVSLRPSLFGFRFNDLEFVPLPGTQAAIAEFAERVPGIGGLLKRVGGKKAATLARIARFAGEGARTVDALEGVGSAVRSLADDIVETVEAADGTLERRVAREAVLNSDEARRAGGAVDGAINGLNDLRAAESAARVRHGAPTSVAARVTEEANRFLLQSTRRGARAIPRFGALLSDIANIADGPGRVVGAALEPARDALLSVIDAPALQSFRGFLESYARNLTAAVADPARASELAGVGAVRKLATLPEFRDLKGVEKLFSALPSGVDLDDVVRLGVEQDRVKGLVTRALDGIEEAVVAVKSRVEDGDLVGPAAVRAQNELGTLLQSAVTVAQEAKRMGVEVQPYFDRLQEAFPRFFANKLPEARTVATDLDSLADDVLAANLPGLSEEFGGAGRAVVGHYGVAVSPGNLADMHVGFYDVIRARINQWLRPVKESLSKLGPTEDLSKLGPEIPEGFVRSIPELGDAEGGLWHVSLNPPADGAVAAGLEVMTQDRAAFVKDTLRGYQAIAAGKTTVREALSAAMRRHKLGTRKLGQGFVPVDRFARQAFIDALGVKTAAEAAAVAARADKDPRILDALRRFENNMDLAPIQRDFIVRVPEAGALRTSIIQKRVAAKEGAAALEVSARHAIVQEAFVLPKEFAIAAGGAEATVRTDFVRFIKSIEDPKLRAQLPEDLRAAADSIARVLGVFGKAIHGKWTRQFFEDYFPRITTLTEKGKHLINAEGELTGELAQLVQRLSAGKSKSRFQMDRSLEWFNDLLELQRRGLLTVETNPARILETYFEHFAQLMTNQRLVDVASRNSALDSLPLMMREGKASAILATINNGAASLPKYQRVRDVPALAGYLVHPDIADDLRKAFGPQNLAQAISNINNPFVRGLFRLNLYIKGAKLSFSPFHAVALSQSLSFAMGPTEAGRTLLNTAKHGQDLNVVQRAFLGTVGGAARAVGAITDPIRRLTGTMGPEMADPAARLGTALQVWGESADLIEFGIMHGLEFDTIERLAGAEFIRFIDDLDRSVKGVDALGKQSVAIEGPGGPGVAKRSPITGVMDINRMIHTTTWEIIHNGGKTRVFSHYMDVLMRAHPERAVDEIAREAAARANANFGGLNWRRMFGDVEVKNALQLMLLAPDWTLANLFTARDLLLNIARPLGPAPGERLGLLLRDVSSPDLAATIGRQYWLNVFMAGFVTTQLANLAINGHTTFQNPGHGIESKLTVWTGQVDQDNGQPINVHTAKQVLEPFQLLENPIRFVQRKASALTGLVGGLALQRDRLGRRITVPEDGTAASAAKNGMFIAESLTPIPASELINLIRRGEKRDTRDIINAFTAPFDVRLRGERLAEPKVGPPDPDELPTTLPRRLLGEPETRIIQ